MFPLGFKLALGWREQVRRGELPEPGGDLYALLRDAGFAFFEFGTGTCRSDQEQALLRQEAAACAQSGLRVSLHPYTRGDEDPAAFGLSAESRAALEAILQAASAVAAITGRPSRLVVHPAQATHEPGSESRAAYRRKLLGRSRGFFRAMKELVAADFPRVLPAVEYQMPTPRDAQVVRIGDVPDELLEAAAGLGLCWDTGHYLLAVERYGLEPSPPAELLSRVEVVHLHDVADGRDHQVISAGSERLRTCPRMLLEQGFDGDVTLEYSAEAIRGFGGFPRVIDESLGALAAWPA